MDTTTIVSKLSEEIAQDKVFIDESMKKHTTFKIGGTADVFIKADSVNTILFVTKLAREEGIPLTIIGNGSNLLVKDNGIRGIVMQIQSENYQIEKLEEKIKLTVEAGMLNGKLSQILLNEAIAGFEFASGIPGTIGGAIRMNAGAYGKEIKDIIKKTTYLNIKNGEIKTISKEEQDLSYRHSMFCDYKEYVILSATFELEFGKRQEIHEKMQEYLELRKSKQPYTMPSAGSTFKRGEDYITAALIDQCELKNYQIGGAKISEIHAGFVVNCGDATARDVLELIQHVKDVVYEKFNKKIQLEIEVMGEGE